MTPAEKQINIFTKQDSSIFFEDTKFLKVQPKDLKIYLKKIYLLNKPILAKIEYQKKNPKNRKKLSQHKIDTYLNLLKQQSSSYIIETSKIHQTLTYFLHIHSDGDIVLNQKEHFFREANTMSELLKTKEIKEVFDTDEISTLYAFNQLRNSLIHSSNYLSFSRISDEYLEAINSLIDDVQLIFEEFSRAFTSAHHKAKLKK